MDSMISIFLQRADNELLLAEKIKLLSEDEDAKNFMKIPADITFYSAVISHSYYAIFYAAKAILLTKGVKTISPEIHKKTLDEFQRNFVDTGVLDVKLLEIYKNMAIRADTLLEIFRDVRQKRGDFTYKTIPQANKEPAGDSIKYAKIFVSNIIKVIEK
jgi:uncharacterized protein (UPF0332 family)